MALSNRQYDFTDYDMVVIEKEIERIEKGIKEKHSKEIALNMLNKKLNITVISEVTGLTIEEVEELKKN